MAVETKCPSCGAVLRMPEAAAGKRVRCPGCRTVLSVPLAAVNLNPYAIPRDLSEAESARSAMRPVPQSIDEILFATWAAFRRRPLAASGFAALLLFLQLSSTGILVALELWLGGMDDPLRGIGFQLASNAVSLLMGAWLQAAVTVYGLQLVRSGQSRFAALTSSLRNYASTLGLQLCTFLVGAGFGVLPFGLIAAWCWNTERLGLAIGFGVLAALLGSVAAAIFYYRTYLVIALIVDQQRGLWQAIRESTRMMHGTKSSAFCVEIISGAVGTVVCIMTLGIATPAVVAFFGLLRPVVYLQMVEPHEPRSSL